MRRRAGALLILLATSGCPVGSEPPRLVAEYEPMRGILVTWDGQFRVPTVFLRQVSERGELWCLVRDRAGERGARAALIGAGVAPERVHVVLARFDGPWPRDYGPFFVRREGRVVAVDFHYDRPRTRDDGVARALAAELGYVYDFVPLVHTGGNLERDTRGTALSTSLVVRENRGSAAYVLAMAGEKLGITDYLIYEDPTSSYHEHANCWIKFVSDRVIAILEVPIGHPWHDGLAAVRRDLEARGYEVHSIPAPGPATYLNALILNGAVFVPTTGARLPDLAALDGWRAAAPDLQVIEVPWDEWLPTDALACRVLAIP